MTLRKVLVASACISVLCLANACSQAPVITPAKAVEITADDYLNKKLFSCNKKEITEEMTEMFEDGPNGKRGERILYVKGEPVEVSREPGKLVCKVTIVTNLGTRDGIFSFVREDNYNLVNWRSAGR